MLSVVGEGAAAPGSAVAVLNDTILDRFAKPAGGGGWARVARALLRHGRGHVAILPTRLDAAPAAPDPAALALLAHHAAGGPLHVVAADAGEREPLARALSAAGLAPGRDA
ncbi:MAG: hypothetical protein QNK04_28465 [Myxococcota bacterium]|nr:hypothetical protein [Myxococcota bacterium]